MSSGNHSKRIDNYLQAHRLEDTLDFILNRVVESYSSNPWKLISNLIESNIKSEILKVKFRAIFILTKVVGVKCEVTTNMGIFTGIICPDDRKAFEIDSAIFNESSLQLSSVLKQTDPRDINKFYRILIDCGHIDSSMTRALTKACFRACSGHEAEPLYRSVSRYQGPANTIKLPFLCINIINFLTASNGLTQTIGLQADLNMVSPELIYSVCEVLSNNLKIRCSSEKSVVFGKPLYGCETVELSATSEKDETPPAKQKGKKTNDEKIPNRPEDIKFLCTPVTVKYWLKVIQDCLDEEAERRNLFTSKREALKLFLNMRNTDSTSISVKMKSDIETKKYLIDLFTTGQSLSRIQDPIEVASLDSPNEVLSSVVQFIKESTGRNVGFVNSPSRQALDVLYAPSLELTTALSGECEPIGDSDVTIEDLTTCAVRHDKVEKLSNSTAPVQQWFSVRVPTSPNPRHWRNKGIQPGAAKTSVTIFDTLRLCKCVVESGHNLTVSISSDDYDKDKPMDPDTFWADAAFGLQADQICLGGLSVAEPSELEKFNRLAEIYDELQLVDYNDNRD